MMTDKYKNLNHYQGAYGSNFKFNDENLFMLNWYSKRMCADIRKSGYESILSLGIGHTVVCRNLAQELEFNVKKHVIVEGAGDIIDKYLLTYGKDEREDIVHCLFEEFETESMFDAVEAGFVMEHVDDPAGVINHLKRFVRPGGKIYLAVPNARSLHRLIGHEANLLDNIYQLSDWDLQLGHKRYFDMNSFMRLALDCGLKIIKVEGIFLKPVTTAQLEALNLAPEVWEALGKVGVDFPDISNSIYMEASI